eukprot:Clim_evm4s195 gene=Clim_evmTU4s195
MVLYFIGLGLGNEQDITVRGLEIVKSADKVFLEAYTSILARGPENFLNKTVTLYGRDDIVIADRELVEQAAETILDPAEGQDTKVAFLVVGDPYGATTHTDLALRAHERKIKVVNIHNASIMNAVAACGLQLYRFGQSISQVFWTDEWQPDSYYDKIGDNMSIGLHTLCLLDIKVKEQTWENLARGRKVYEPPRFMTVTEALEQLLACEERHGRGLVKADTIVIGVARLGQDDQLIVSGTVSELMEVDFGKPLHSLVIAGDVHETELECVAMHAKNKDTFEAMLKEIRSKLGPQ